MILRKPYAILIKHFKLIHVFLTLISVFLFLRCHDILNFINDYIVNSGFIVEDYQIDKLMPFYLNTVVVFMIIFNIIVAILLKNKGKSITFYIINIVFNIILLISFIYSGSLFDSMQIKIVDTRIVRALRDLFTALDFILIISFIMYAFRATGFDVKKFNFTKDLIDLQIEEEDNEEVEVAVDIDVNKIDRTRRKLFRMIKYFYLENKFICDIVLSSVSIIVLVFVIFNLLNKEESYKQFELYNTSGYSFQIEDVYVTNKDKDGNVIFDDKSFVILEVKIKKNGTSTQKLISSRFEIKANNRTYYHNNVYNKYFDDFGNVYINQDLKSDFERYFLVYMINNSDMDNKIYLNYVDLYRERSFNINLVSLDNNKIDSIILNEEKTFKNSIITDYKLLINKYELNDKITVNYKYCPQKDKCINAKEYIVPNISSNYDKAVLRIDGSLNVPESYNSYVTSMENLITRFGYIKYIKNNKVYYSDILGVLKSNMVNQPNTSYYEVKEDVLSADKVTLVIRVRNISYELLLKGGV